MAQYQDLIRGKMNLLKTSFAPVILISLLCFLYSATKAQPGIKLGGTISNFYYTDKEMNPYLAFDIDLRPYLGYDIEGAQLGEQKPVIYPYLGVYYNFQFSKRFGLRPEICFTQKGVSFSQSEYEDVVYKVKISYLEVPLSVGYAFIQKEKFMSEIYLGGYAAFKIKAVKKVGTHYTEPEKTELNSVENFDAGIHLGLNLKFKFFEKFFLFDMRVFQGLTNIFYMPQDYPSMYFETQKTKITGFNLTLGYEF